MRLLCLSFTIVSCLLLGCGKPPQETFKIAINPWPGYEFLHLAEHLGYFEVEDLPVELVPFGSLSDAQRAYIHGRVDGLASTIIEAVQSQALGGRPLKIVLVPDFSNGGDVIVASNLIDSMDSIEGVRVGCEIGSLGIYLLSRALEESGLSLDDIELVNVEQSNGARAMDNGDIDVFVTYPPISLEILKQPNRTIIFSSAEIPYEIVDTVAVAHDVLEKHPTFVSKLRNVWRKALEYTEKNPEQAYAIMAQREGITSEEFQEALGDLKIIGYEEQIDIFSKPGELDQQAKSVCEVLNRVDAIEYNCQELGLLTYRQQ
ncbi:ABC transporter substrate-binding protein [Aurantivibrio plasticivorans]